MSTHGVTAFAVNANLGYSQAVHLGSLLFVSGQVAWDERGEVVGVGDAKAQAEKAFANLQAVLERSGSSLDRVGKILMLATSRDYLPILREVRQRVFGRVGHYPASTFAVVEGLAVAELLVEVEAVALVDTNS
jgi:enamine deaminase RidA (YjgF/YER057c/UK114 family)